MVIKFLRSLYVRYPLAGNVVVYGALYSAGDISQQKMSKKPQIDFDSAKRVGSLGATVFGPFYLFWYRYLDRLVPGAAGRAVVKKIIADQAIAGPVGLFIFFTGTSILEKKQNIFEDAITKGPKAFLTGCVYWPLVQSVNFALLPPQYRALYTGVCAFVWTTALCYFRTLGPEEIHV